MRVQKWLVTISVTMNATTIFAKELKIILHYRTKPAVNIFSYASMVVPYPTHAPKVNGSIRKSANVTTAPVLVNFNSNVHQTVSISSPTTNIATNSLCALLGMFNDWNRVLFEIKLIFSVDSQFLWVVRMDYILTENWVNVTSQNMLNANWKYVHQKTIRKILHSFPVTIIATSRVSKIQSNEWSSNR